MRELCKVIDEMLEVIPVSEDVLRSSLEAHRASAIYTAPESMGDRWGGVLQTLAGKMPREEQDFSEWHKQVLEIWRGDGQKENCGEEASS